MHGIGNGMMDAGREIGRMGGRALELGGHGLDALDITWLVLGVVLWAALMTTLVMSHDRLGQAPAQAQGRDPRQVAPPPAAGGCPLRRRPYESPPPPRREGPKALAAPLSSNAHESYAHAAYARLAGMGKRIASLIRKEFIQIRRDKRTLVMMVAIPLIWIVLFGYAATFDVPNIRAVVAVPEDSLTAALVAAELEKSDSFQVVERGPLTDAELEAAIEEHRASVAVRPPEPGKPGLFIADGSDLFMAQAAVRQIQARPAGASLNRPEPRPT